MSRCSQTSAGSAAGLDLCLELVRQDFGGSAANAVARRMVFAPRREGNQAQFVINPHASASGGAGAGLGELRLWAQRNLDTVNVASLAARAGVSERTLALRFHQTHATTPQRWIQRERLAVGQELLETSDLTISAIARRVGLGSASNLRQQFMRTFDTTPSAYRARFTSRPRADKAPANSAITSPTLMQFS